MVCVGYRNWSSHCHLGASTCVRMACFDPLTGVEIDLLTAAVSLPQLGQYNTSVPHIPLRCSMHIIRAPRISMENDGGGIPRLTILSTL